MYPQQQSLIDRFLVLGSDYDLALQEIAYYRVCHEKSQLIQDYVTFHLYAEIKYANQLDINSWPEVNCEKWTSAADSVTFKQGEYRKFFSYFFGQRLIIFLFTTSLYFYGHEIPLYFRLRCYFTMETSITGS